MTRSLGHEQEISIPFVICDFDGTISLTDSTDLMLERFADPGWRDIEQEWVNGKIGSKECLGRQLQLVRAKRADLQGLLEEIPLDPYFSTFAAYCRAEEIPLAIVSESFDFFVVPLLKKRGLDCIPKYINRLTVRGEKMFPSFPYSGPRCSNANCKCSVLDSVQATTNGFILVGDGLSDVCVAAYASMVFAKKKPDGSDGPLLEQCRGGKIPCRPFTDFQEVLEVLRQSKQKAGRYKNKERCVPQN